MEKEKGNGELKTLQCVPSQIAGQTAVSVTVPQGRERIAKNWRYGIRRFVFINNNINDHVHMEGKMGHHIIFSSKCGFTEQHDIIKGDVRCVNFVVETASHTNPFRLNGFCAGTHLIDT